jgi:regulatory protein
MVAGTLRRGEHVSGERIKELQMADSCQKAYDRALHYLSYRPRSSAEVRSYLTGKGVPSEVSAEVLRRLRTAGLLDDLAFCRYWVENRETFKPRSRGLLRQELRRKGVDDEVVAEVLVGVKDEESAYRAGLKQAVRYDSLDDEVFQRRMQSFLRRRGFSYGVIRETIASLLRERNSTRFQAL